MVVCVGFGPVRCCLNVFDLDLVELTRNKLTSVWNTFKNSVGKNTVLENATTAVVDVAPTVVDASPAVDTMPSQPVAPATTAPTTTNNISMKIAPVSLPSEFGENKRVSETVVNSLQKLLTDINKEGAQ